MKYFIKDAQMYTVKEVYHPLGQRFKRAITGAALPSAALTGIINLVLTKGRVVPSLASAAAAGAIVTPISLMLQKPTRKILVPVKNQRRYFHKR